MRKFPQHREDVFFQCFELLSKKGVSPLSATDDQWETTYQIVWAMAAVEMAQWKLDNLDRGLLLGNL